MPEIVSRSDAAQKAMVSDEVQETIQRNAAKQATMFDSQKDAQMDAVNPFAAKFKTAKPIKAHSNRITKMTKPGEAAPILAIGRIKDSAKKFQQRNPELKEDALVLLRKYIKPGDSKEEILRKIREFYPDVTLADEALEFLLDTSDGELAEQVQQAKEEHNLEHKREITAGRNISAYARAASEKGLGTPTSLRDLYRDVTGNPPDTTALFQDLAQKYAYKDMKKVTFFLLHSLGSDMKSKGPSIEPGELSRLFETTREVQAVLGVYRFFEE